MPKKLLIVDDEPNNLQLLRQILKDEYALVFARDGEEALMACRKHLPDLILLDIMMPQMDGYETCRLLKEDNRLASIPVIFVTAMSDDEDETRGFALGAVDYITKPVSASVVKARVKNHLTLVRVEELEESHRTAIFMLGDAGHYNDTDTGVHIWRMAAYSSCLAKALGWDADRSKLLELAAPMHDTGKIGIPDFILKKKGKLSDEEWLTMKQHSRIGYGILSKSKTPLFQAAAEIALHHHEKWDGTGYPDGLQGEEIDVMSRIVAVADVFDALSMKRPYKEAWPVEDIVVEIKNNAGKHFDPEIVEIFENVLPEILKIKSMWDEQSPT